VGTVVVTGSSKGIGRGLATEFIRRGHDVVVTARDPIQVEQAAQELTALGPGRATGVVCDVTKKSDVEALWQAAVRTFGRVDWWINNAGHADAQWNVHEMPEPAVHKLIDGNFKGTIFGSQVAALGMRAQGSGALYNMLGGSFGGGRVTPNMGVYSSTKAAVWKLTQYLVAENKGTGVLVGSISPGMLISDNWFQQQKQMTPEEWVKIRPFLNILCDHVDTAAPWLVEQVLANRESGKRIAWLTNGKITGRFFDAYVLRRKRDLFSRYGL